MALAYAGVACELREVVLKHKPNEMLEASPKGTVPVLVLPDGRVMDESLSIIDWALQQRSGDSREFDGKASSGDLSAQADLLPLIATNDGAFKYWLDRYKYADRFPARSAAWYRDQAIPLLRVLDDALGTGHWLDGDSWGKTDIALFPFVRQFAMVDHAWFVRCSLENVQRWLDGWLASKWFNGVMTKYPPWTPSDSPIVFAPDIFDPDFGKYDFAKSTIAKPLDSSSGGV